jgi:hypothetical protein
MSQCPNTPGIPERNINGRKKKNVLLKKTIQRKQNTVGRWDIIIFLFQTFKKIKREKGKRRKRKIYRKFEIRNQKCPKRPNRPTRILCIDREL